MVQNMFFPLSLGEFWADLNFSQSQKPVNAALKEGCHNHVNRSVSFNFHFLSSPVDISKLVDDARTKEVACTY